MQRGEKYHYSLFKQSVNGKIEILGFIKSSAFVNLQVHPKTQRLVN
jgi:hypothetical protein